MFIAARSLWSTFLCEFMLFQSDLTNHHTPQKQHSNKMNALLIRKWATNQILPNVMKNIRPAVWSVYLHWTLFSPSVLMHSHFRWPHRWCQLSLSTYLQCQRSPAHVPHMCIVCVCTCMGEGSKCPIRKLVRQMSRGAAMVTAEKPPQCFKRS